ncbi:hypothetical protein D3C78_1496580 [compost metagenome]
MGIHIGRKIEQVFQESGMKPSEFASRLQTVPRNIYAIFKREDIYVEQLRTISKILKHDFFQYYQEDTSVFSVGNQPVQHKKEPPIELFIKLNVNDEQHRELLKSIVRRFDL